MFPNCDMSAMDEFIAGRVAPTQFFLRKQHPLVEQNAVAREAMRIDLNAPLFLCARAGSASYDGVPVPIQSESSWELEVLHR